jgi:MYXO-CTERM domain-containing protein
MNHRCLALSVAAALALVWAPAAHASPTFPAEVQSTLGMPCAPPCIICHATSLGGIGTAVRPFGLAVHARGAHAGNIAGLRGALGLLEAEGVDSNHDGVGDVAELRQGRNPNDGTGLCGLQYGCAVSAAPPRTPDRGDGLVTLAVLIGLLARRRVRAALGL